jgi:hypothetical protein
MNLLLANNNAFKKDFSEFRRIEVFFKRTFFIKVFILFLVSIISTGAALQAQICDGVTAQAVPKDPQNDPDWDYYGVRVNLSNTASTNVYVQGYIHDAASISSGYPFHVTVPPGSTEAQTPTDIYHFERWTNVTVTIASVYPCPSDEITATYAGVTITYEAYNNILRFNSASDFNTVLNQLEADYDAYNDNYDAQYPSLTPEQMDDIDAVNNFDEFAPYKNFENLLSGFVSKRSEIESIENAWINSDFTSTDPDDIDLTFDDAMNTVFNSDNAFKIGSDTYQLTSYGLYINGTLQASVKKPFHNDVDFASYKTEESYGMYTNALFQNNSSAFFAPGCQTNKKNKIFPDPIGNHKYKLKIAITSVGVRSGVRFKVKHFSLKNGHWKHTRTKMAVYLIGSVRNPSCNVVESYNERKPSPNGWKNRRQLKIQENNWAIVWKAYPNDLGGSFETAAGHTGSLVLTW